MNNTRFVFVLERDQKGTGYGRRRIFFKLYPVKKI